MENPYIEYYSEQAGSGITGYAGNRYHVGNGFFGKILKNLKPALKYIGKQGWDALKSMSSDVMNGESLGKAATNSLINTASNVMSDATTKLQQYKKRKQNGGGRKRKRRTKKSKKPKKLYKTKAKPKSKKKPKKSRTKKSKKKSKKKSLIKFL